VSASGLTVQWQAVNPSTGVVENLEATGLTLLLRQEHVGRKIRAQVSYVDPYEYQETLTVLSDSAVVDVNDAPQGGIWIVGEPLQGGQLSVDWNVSDVDSPQGLTPEQWSWTWYAKPADLRPEVEIGKGSSVLLTQAQVGSTITVKGFYKDAQQYGNEVLSQLLGPVINVADTPTGELKIRLRDAQGQAVDGVWEQGRTLMVVDDVADVDGIPASGAGAKSYQWLLNGTQVIGTGPTLTLTQSHVGNWDGLAGGMGDALVSARVRYVDDFGETYSIESVDQRAVRNANETPTGALQITGDLTAGSTLTVGPGTLKDGDGIDRSLIEWSWLVGAGGARSGAFGLRAGADRHHGWPTGCRACALRRCFWYD